MSSSYKLIFICQVFYPDKTSTSQLFTPLIQSLRKQGIEVLVICGFPVKGDSSKVLRKEEFNGVTIKRCGETSTQEKFYFAKCSLFDIFI